jgi:hypothetical protein
MILTVVSQKGLQYTRDVHHKHGRPSYWRDAAIDLALGQRVAASISPSIVTGSPRTLSTIHLAWLMLPNALPAVSAMSLSLSVWCSIVFTDVLHTLTASVNLLAVEQFHLRGLSSCFSHDGVVHIVDIDSSNLRFEGREQGDFFELLSHPISMASQTAGAHAACAVTCSARGMSNLGTSVWRIFVASGQCPPVSTVLS